MVTYVSVPVPAHLVPEVMALIGARMASSPTGGSGIPLLWSLDEFRRVWNESGAAMRVALQLMAANPGSAVSAGAVGKALGKSDRSVAGMMGAFGKRCQNRYDGRKPFESSYNAVDRHWEYTMSVATAGHLRKVSGAGD